MFSSLRRVSRNIISRTSFTQSEACNHATFSFSTYNHRFNAILSEPSFPLKDVAIDTLENPARFDPSELWCIGQHELEQVPATTVPSVLDAEMPEFGIVDEMLMDGFDTWEMLAPISALPQPILSNGELTCDLTEMLQQVDMIYADSVLKKRKKKMNKHKHRKRRKALRMRTNRN